MTLVVALKSKQGVVVASDSLVTFSPDTPLMREESSKIYTLGQFGITGVGLAGPIDNLLKKVNEKYKSRPLSSYDELVELCEDLMWQYYQKYAERIKKVEEEDWDILLMSSDRLTRILSSGWSEEEPNYTIDGSGELYAEYIVKQRFRKNLSLKEAKAIAYYTVYQTSKIDPNVGGKICLSIIDKNGVSEVRDLELDEIYGNVTGPTFETEKEVQRSVHEIVEKRRWINTTFHEKFGFDLFKESEYSISEIQKSCKNEADFTSKITALALLIDMMNVKELNKGLSKHPNGSINLLETFLGEKSMKFKPELITNLRDIMVLRSKKMPIHEDDPMIIKVILKWGHKIPPNWSSLWKQALIKYKEALVLLADAISK